MPTGQYKCLSIRNVHSGPGPNQVHIYVIYILIVQVLLNVPQEAQPQNKEKNSLVLQRLIHQRGMFCTGYVLVTNYLPSGWLIMKKKKTHKNDYSGSSWSSGKQYLQFITCQFINWLVIHHIMTTTTIPC